VNNRRTLFVQAVRGPILLITLGVLFAIQQAGIIAFSRTWPLILIVIGLTKLIERAVAPPQPFVPTPPPGGPVR
jgi:uncharacterized membrane protein